MGMLYRGHLGDENAEQCVRYGRVDTEYVHDHLRYSERWTWLPSAGPADAPLLRKLAINLVPFMWTAPFLIASSALTEVSFSRSTRGGNGVEVAQADPVYKLLAHPAPTLRALRLEIAALQPAFLPIADIAMPALEELTSRAPRRS